MTKVLSDPVTENVIKLIFMKAVKIVSNPYTLTISFLFIIISGQHLGGFYIIYLLLALPHFGIYAILALIGILLLLITFHSKKLKSSITGPIVNIVGALMLSASIFLFFYTDNEHYNYGTFYQLVPLVTLILFSIISLTSIVINAFELYKILSKKNLHNLNI